MIEVEPEAEPLTHLAPLVDVLVHRRLATRVELGDPVLLDLLLAADLQSPLDLELDREPMGVPSGLPSDREPGHLRVAREDVPVGAGEDVVESGKPVGGRGSLVEHVRRRVATHREAALEHVGALPEIEDLELRLGKTRAGADGRIPGHCPKDTGRSFATELRRAAMPPARRRWPGRSAPWSRPPRLRLRSRCSCPR